jgi:hypothetical protein
VGTDASALAAAPLAGDPPPDLAGDRPARPALRAPRPTAATPLPVELVATRVDHAASPHGLSADGAFPDPTLAEPRPEPGAATLPAHLHLEVADPLGAWSMDLHRNDQTLDILIRGDAALRAAVSGGTDELRQALAAGGHTLGLLEFAASSHGGGQHPPAQPTPRPAAPARPAALTSATNSATPARPRRRGLRIDRVA